MSSPTTAKSSSFRIFVNYRRADSAGHAGRLWDTLRIGAGEEGGFAEDQIFMDIDTIPPGVDFRSVIQEAVGSCDVLVSIVGRHWLDAVDSEGRRRLDDPNDFVRVEIEVALERGIPVLPVLVHGAQMPAAADLPESLSEFVYRNARELSDARWHHDVGQIIAWLKQLERETTQRSPAEAPSLEAAEPVAQEKTWSKPKVRIKHEKSVMSIAFSLDGSYIATGSTDMTARVCDTATGREVARLTHDLRVDQVVLSPDGSYLVTTTSSAQPDNPPGWVWETATGRMVIRLDHPGPQGMVGLVASPDGRYVASQSPLAVWEIATGQKTFQHDRRERYAFAFSPDGKYLASIEGDHVRVRETATGRIMTAVKQGGFWGPVYAVAFSPDGRYVASADSQKTIRVWEALTGDDAARMTHEKGVTVMAFSPDGRSLASGSGDKTARVWDLTTAREISRQTHGARVLGLAFSPDGRLVTSADDSVARIWEASTGRQLDVVPFKKSGGGTVGLSISSDGRYLATRGDEAETALMWELAPAAAS
jgi:WD40 repeat protein